MSIDIFATDWNMADALRELADYIDKSENLPNEFEYNNGICTAMIKS